MWERKEGNELERFKNKQHPLAADDYTCRTTLKPHNNLDTNQCTQATTTTRASVVSFCILLNMVR